MFKSEAIVVEPTDEDVHVEQWHLGIDKKQLRWESYVKAGYYVRLMLSHHLKTKSVL
jgi:galactokinase